MFAKKTENLPNDRDVKAFLEEGCEFEGKLSFSGVVRMNGKFRGEIHSNDTLIVGETANLEGIIVVGALILGGKIKGEVTALHRAEIMQTGVLEGTLVTPQIVVKEGAVILAQLRVQQDTSLSSSSTASNTSSASMPNSTTKISAGVDNSGGSQPKEQSPKQDSVVTKDRQGKAS